MVNSVTSRSMDELFSAMPTGSLDRAILNNLRGVNHRQIQGALPLNKDMPGLTFFVRPQLNMQKDNIRNVRKLSSLLTNNSTSIQRYVAAMLDPRLCTGVSFAKGGTIPPLDCPIIDNLSAFITPFTNNLISVSGWPSISLPTFNSKPGLYNESYFMVDGRALNSETYDITVNLRNTRGDPTLFILYVWAVYMSLVFEGKLVPYLDFITENELDYCTRVYRIVLDYTKRRVTKITACHAAIPTGVPIGDSFDIPSDKPFIEANGELSVRFKCAGVDYYDDILVKEFNTTVEVFNPSMKDENRSGSMIAVPPRLIEHFNHLGYPRIDPETSNLDWYVPVETFNAVTTRILGGIPETNSEDYIGD